MPSGRRIFFSHECDAAAQKLGGYARIDKSLDAFWDGLHKNPYGFPKFESDWFSVRYIITRPMPGLPSLVWSFTISGKDIEIVHVEEFERY